MATVDTPQTDTDRRRPFRALESSFDDTIARWHPRAHVEVDGDDHDLLIGGDTSGPSPRATVTLIGTSGSLIRGGTLIGDSGTRAPLEPASPAGSGGAPVHDSPDEADPDIDQDLLASLASDRERLVEIARALGACPDCWGESIGCPRCGGVGRPGTENPSSEAFEWYVRPLLARLDVSGAPRDRTRPAGSHAHPSGRGPSFWDDPD